MMFSMNKANFFPVNTVVLYTGICVLSTLILLCLFFFLRKRLKGKRMMITGIWTSFWIFSAVILLATGAFGEFVDVKTVNNKLYSKKELTQDLQQVENCIMKENPLIFADKKELQKRFSITYDMIEEEMTELEFYRLLNPLVADVNCGHTNLLISEGLQKNRVDTAKFFPLEVTLVDNSLYVVEGEEAVGIKPGDKIKSINGKSSDDIIKILLDNISGDGNNRAKPKYIISKYFNSRFYDFVDNSERFRVEYIDSEGNLKQAILNAEYVNEYNVNAWGLHFVEYQDGNYYESEIMDDYAVLSIHVFMPEEGEDFASFLDNFFLELKERDIKKLIIDLRGNFGASQQMAKRLLSHLTSKEIEYFTGKMPLLQTLFGFAKPVTPAGNVFNGQLVVLTDGSNFSTTAHFCALVKFHKLGTLLGSKTGGTYICTDSSKDTVLKNTRIRLHYSTLVYRVAVKGLPANKGIEPDIEVIPAIEDILNNQDVQMKRAKQVLGVL